MPLQIDDLPVDITNFSIEAARLLGLELTQDLDNAEEWLNFQLTSCCNLAVDKMQPGEIFTSKDIIQACHLVCPEAIIL